MSFIAKWLINIVVLCVIAVFVYAFLPSVWYLVWGLATGFYRCIFIVGLLSWRPARAEGVEVPHPALSIFPENGEGGPGG